MTIFIYFEAKLRKCDELKHLQACIDVKLLEEGKDGGSRAN